MKVRALGIPGLLLIEPVRHADPRGWFAEAWEAARYREIGINEPFVQDNLAHSMHGVLRGLHAQSPHRQGKLVQALTGAIFDVAVDARAGSPAFGRWYGMRLDAASGTQLYLPPGLLHGYYVLSEAALVGYKVTDRRNAEDEFAVRWDDPDIGIEWPLAGPPRVSNKDANAPLLRDVPAARLEGG